jgi:pyruvate kinase
MEKGTNTIKVKCLNYHVLSSRKGVLILGTIINLPAITEKDKVDIKFPINNWVDFITASFVRKAT